MIVKQHRARGEIYLYSEKKDKSDIGDDMDLDKANDKFLLQLCQEM